MSPSEAQSLVGHVLPPSRFERMVAADHPDRLLAMPETTRRNLFFFVDATHERPLCVAKIIDGRVHVIAQFANSGDCARLYCPDGKTLPADIVRQMAGQ